MNIKDYLYKTKELPYWEEEVIDIVEQILAEHDKEIRIDENKYWENKCDQSSTAYHNLKISAVDFENRISELEKIK